MSNDIASELLTAVENLRVWQQKGRRAVHKPLLLLIALGRIQRKEPRFASFQEIEHRLRPLLERYGTQKSSPNSAYPFWRLQHDGIWEVRNQSGLIQRKSNTDPTLTSLRREQASGGLLEKYDALLRQQPELLKRIARHLLEQHFRESPQHGITSAAGLTLD